MSDIKFEVIKKISELGFKYKNLNVSKLDSNSPPSVFIGSKLKYPLVNVGILSPLERDEDAWVYDDAKYWANNDFQIIDVLETVSGASFTVSEVHIPNINEEIGISGNLYQAFNITAKNITNTQIKNVTIDFRVNRTWLSEKGGSSSDIRLHRKENSTSRWETLLTILEDEDDNYYHYSAISPGFSTFAIFYGRYECQPGANRCYNEQSQLCLGNSTWLITEKCRFGCENGKCIKTAPQSVIIYTLMIAIVSVAIIITSYVLLRKIHKKKV
jgi:PGF-pre-PGF domain-containing protein